MKRQNTGSAGAARVANVARVNGAAVNWTSADRLYASSAAYVTTPQIALVALRKKTDPRLTFRSLTLNLSRHACRDRIDLSPLSSTKVKIYLDTDLHPFSAPKPRSNRPRGRALSIAPMVSVTRETRFPGHTQCYNQASPRAHHASDVGDLKKGSYS